MWPAGTSVGGFLGTGYQSHAAGTGSSAFTWNFPVAQAASYQVHARWTAHPNRATNATYTLASASGNVAVSVNQQVNGGAWQLLGTFAFNAGNASVTLTDQANGFVIADAVMLVPVGAEPQHRHLAGHTPQCRQLAALGALARAPEPRERCSFRVGTAGGMVPVTVNQQANGGSWQLLGTFAFNAGSPPWPSPTRPTASSMADAVEFKPEEQRPGERHVDSGAQRPGAFRRPRPLDGARKPQRQCKLCPDPSGRNDGGDPEPANERRRLEPPGHLHLRPRPAACAWTRARRAT